ncbi:hypothetical protein LY10_02540 [Planktotalea frisia]|jgi:hypothetical protein|uniref:Uncharacterized protein n=1 Tax=Planktotalea frisia TaxID=696762 RepID=A0A1L9NV37_9RHOB|nr:hypothetical protein [Planktotalea frisia]OJI93156.1 hypothetical protein PFRI_26150 [Planktotalea frisia]PZX26666.1 hypothetical protein LY10_02540 [Planktotalea frisia]
MSTKVSKLNVVAQQAFTSKKTLLLKNAQLESEIQFTLEKIKTLQEMLETSAATLKDQNVASVENVEKLKSTIEAKSVIIKRLEGNRETLRERNAKLVDDLAEWRRKYEQAIDASRSSDDV